MSFVLANSRFLPLKDNSIDCVITSPPYWALRKYDIPDLVWDENKDCNHEWGEPHFFYEGRTSSHGRTSKISNKAKIGQDSVSSHIYFYCKNCGAWKGQLGLEPTFDLYLEHLIEIFDEVKRVLKPEGTCWVVMGDTYAGSNCGSNDYRAMQGLNPKYKHFSEIYKGQRAGRVKGIQNKSMCLIPYRFAIRMIERGWILRNQIIWHKPNCMPSSAHDRFTVDYEPIFFFTKSKKYYFRQQREGNSISKIFNIRVRDVKLGRIKYFDRIASEEEIERYREGYKEIAGRNKRCVWTIPTQPYSESHFATFPKELVEPMIRAGCPPNGIVLDPFCGSGTVLAVANELNIRAIGIDLGYKDLVKKRLNGIQKKLF